MNTLILGPARRNAPIVEHLVSRGIQCTQTENPVTAGNLVGIDWVVSNGYAPILKADAIAAVKGNVINIHPTFLPYGRGIFPLFWALFHGWPTGVSLHLIDSGIDTGPLLARRRIDPAGPQETLRTFNQRLLHEATQLFVDSWAGIADGSITAQPQEPVPSSLVFKTRLQSEPFVELLPDLWDTPLETVRELGAAFRGNLHFLQHTAIANLEAKS